MERRRRYLHGVAARALHIHEVRVGALHKALQLVAASLLLLGGVEEVFEKGHGVERKGCGGGDVEEEKMGRRWAGQGSAWLVGRLEGWGGEGGARRASERVWRGALAAPYGGDPDDKNRLVRAMEAYLGAMHGDFEFHAGA